ncbi:MAG: YchJ family protein [Bdellovibrionaceae bacterium]|nr:YchJ family protein [Pseudobdellovibrionaceae bacterium]
MQCYCGSHKEFANCCEPYLNQTQWPETPETLMRSRYSAYVTGNIKYLKQTLLPHDRAQFQESDTQDWAKSEWLGLKIIETNGNTVEFVASYKKNGKKFEHHEISKFKKIDGRWYFSSGDSHVHEEGHDHHHHHEPVAPIQREAPKIQRNDPCPCGSGKKYKKCCGA